MKKSDKSGPFADPKVRAKRSHVTGQSGANEQKRKAKMERAPFVLPKREAEFSAFRIASNGDRHYLEVRDHTQKWKRDGNRFDSERLLLKHCAAALGMTLYKKGPYLQDANYPGKPPCWHAGIAKHINLD